MPIDAPMPTKLHHPPIPSGWVDRPLLLRRLTAGLEAGRRVTLVSAPAGFGKSTCVSQWVDSLEDLPSAWLSLDPSDDDPGCFFSSLTAALQTVDANLGRDIRGMLRAGEIPSAENLSAALTADILTFNSPFVLVLDDLHHIQDPLIQRTLERLISFPPPQIHLVLLTREDPPLSLARLRAHGGLTEIRAADLRFTPDDTGVFLRQTMNLSLSENDIALLEEKTEGWIAGLQLAALALQGMFFNRPQRAPSAFIASLKGSHRYILQYLTEQVLMRLPEETRAFLLETSILDELSAGVCNAVTGRTDSAAVLERLYAENLFLLPLDDEGRWYRYHHLFADLLRDLLLASPKDRWAQLHRRACRWYASEGNSAAAVEHALAAADYSAALELLEDHAADLIMQGHVKTLDAWVQALPSEQESRSPKINLAFAWMHILRGSALRAEPYIKRLREIFQNATRFTGGKEEEDSLKAEWLVIQALISYGRGDLEECGLLAEEAMENTPEKNARVLSLACYTRAGAHCALEEYPQAERLFRIALRHARQAGNQIAELLSTAGLSIMAFEHGQLRLASEIINPAVERLEESESKPSMSCVIYGALAEVCYQRLQLEEARRYMLKALRLNDLGGYAGRIGCRVFLSRLDLLEGKTEDAATNIREAGEQIEEDTPAFIFQETAAQQVRLHLALDNLSEAEQTLHNLGFSFNSIFDYPCLSTEKSLTYSAGLMYTGSLHIILYRADTLGDRSLLSAGLILAGKLIEAALGHNSVLTAMEALLLRARLRAAEETAGSLSLKEVQKDILKALNLGEPEGILGVFHEQGEAVRPFLEDLLKQPRLKSVFRGYIKHILTPGFRSSPPPKQSLKTEKPPAGPGARIPTEPLTDRELEVLARMAEGLKYREIADRLYVSLNTIRFHVKTIYGKLDVGNRTRAIEKARFLGLL